jgi:hypothetical protein
MRFAIEVAPPYSMVVVMDPSVGQIPESWPDAIDILATLPDGMDAGQPAE